MSTAAFGQSLPPFRAANSTWMMYQGAAYLTGLQLLKGAVAGPNVKCTDDSLGRVAIGDPLVADINGDGLNEIVILTSGMQIYAFRGTDCSIIWSRPVQGSYTPAIGDLNPSIPGLEIVVGYIMGGIYALSGTDGSEIWSDDYLYAYSPPSIADVDGDGFAEVFISTGYTLDAIYALRGTDGSIIWSRPIGGTYGNIAIGDINNDGDYELVTFANGGVLVLRATDGSTLWHYYTGSFGEVSLGDLDNDGYLEVVANVNLYVPDSVFPPTDSMKVYVLRNNGVLYWSKTLLGGASMGNINSPTIGDINGDGILDVVFGTYDYHEMAGYVYGLRGNDGNPILYESIGISPNDSVPSIKLGDIDNDGGVEVVIANRELRVSGEWIDSSDYFKGLSIADVDNDGCSEIIATTRFMSPFTFYVFDSPTPVSSCGTLGYGEAFGNKPSHIRFSVMAVKGGVIVETDKAYDIGVYNTSGKLIRVVKVSGRGFINLDAGVYIVGVKGVYKTAVVKP